MTNLSTPSTQPTQPAPEPMPHRRVFMTMVALPFTVLLVGLSTLTVVLHSVDMGIPQAQRAMENDPALPFVAWQRAIDDATSPEARVTLNEARGDTLGAFEAPLKTEVAVDVLRDGLPALERAWSGAHATPGEMFQMLGGMDAYRAAVRAAQAQARRRDALANLNAGRVHREDLLAQALPALVPVGR